MPNSNVTSVTQLPISYGKPLSFMGSLGLWLYTRAMPVPAALTDGEYYCCRKHSCNLVVMQNSKLQQ